MNQFMKMPGIVVLAGLTLAGCQSMGGGLEDDATPFTRAELYAYLGGMTQATSGGGYFYSVQGTLESLDGEQSAEGTWSTHDGGKLCRHIESQEDSCETYYHSGDAVSIVSEGAYGETTAMAGELTSGNTLIPKVMFTKEQASSFVSGKTVVWTDAPHSGAYYSPDGVLHTIWEGATEEGTWDIDDDAGVCWHIPSWGETPCEYYYRADDGSMRKIYEDADSAADEFQEGNTVDSL